MKKTMTVLLLLATAVSASAVPLRVMSWNIQDGMWDGQGDDYARFVAYVKEKAPDVCVWTEAESLLKTGKCEDLPSEERFLPKGWPALAARYGHRYVYLAEHRDNYPQVITSRFPIDNVKRISGRKDNPVCHGAGWATITVAGHKINLVTFHAWPLGWKFDCWNPEERRKESIAAHGGDFQRRDEIEQVCTETILGRSAETGDLWLMAGDFNAGARSDNAWYRLPEDDPSFMLHDWIAEHTPYVDIVKRMHPDVFMPSVFNDRPGYGYKGGRRIDFVYLTPELARHAVAADVVKDDYACSVRDAARLGANLRHPSDHLPVIVDFNLPDRDGDGGALFRFDGEIGAKTGWRLVQQEKGKVVYIPFEGYYESKGGRVESTKFDLKGARYMRLVFSARAKADGYWWVDQFDNGGKCLPDINSRVYASSGWKDYEVMVPLSGSAVTGQVAFVSEKGVDVRDVRIEGVDAMSVADWCDRLYATLPQIEAGDLSAAWAKLPRSRERLLSGKPLRVVLLGDSIVNDTYCGNAAALVQREFPNVEFVLSVRGSTGCWYYRDPKHFEEYVMRHKPDLVLVGGISNGKNNADYSTAEEDMVAVIELALKSGIEVAVMSPPPSYEWRKTPEQTDWDENFVFTHYDIYAKGLKNWQPLRRDYQRAATEKTGVAYWDLTTAPCNAISRSRKPLNWFHRDVCHNDDRGKQLIARTFAAHFHAAAPAKAWKVRAVQLDLARQMETVGFVKRYLAFAKESGYNTVQLYLEGRIRTKSFPFRPVSETYSPDQMQEIVTEAGRLGLDLVPVVSVLGHAENFVNCRELDDLCEESRAGRGRFGSGGPKMTFCHSVPRTRKFLEDYLSEIMEIFPGGNFHVGLDESFNTGFCPECAAQMESVGLGGVYLDVIRWAHDFLAGHGKRMWMWGDFFEFFPDKVVELPRDIVICDWEYSEDISRNRGHYGCFGDRYRRDWLRFYGRLGIEALACPSHGKRPMTRYCDWAESCGASGGIFVQWEMNTQFHARQMVRVRATGIRWQEGLSAVSYDEAMERAVRQLFPSLDERERQAVLALVVDSTAEARVLARKTLEGRIRKAVPMNPFSEEGMLDDLVVAARQGVAARVLSDAEYAVSGVSRTADGVRAAKRRVAGVRHELEEIRDRRRAQEEVWRPACAPGGLASPAKSLIEKAESLMGIAEDNPSPDEWQVELSFLLPDMHGIPMWTVEGRFGSNWRTLGEGRWKPDAGEWCYFERTLMFRGDTPPDALRISYKGYNDGGLAYVAVANKDARFVPAKVISRFGRVRDAENVLEDTVDAAFFGNPNCRSAMLNPALADEVSSVEIALKPEFAECDRVDMGNGLSDK